MFPAECIPITTTNFGSREMLITVKIFCGFHLIFRPSCKYFLFNENTKGLLTF